MPISPRMTSSASTATRAWIGKGTAEPGLSGRPFRAGLARGTGEAACALSGETRADQRIRLSALAGTEGNAFGEDVQARVLEMESAASMLRSCAAPSSGAGQTTPGMSRAFAAGWRSIPSACSPASAGARPPITPCARCSVPARDWTGATALATGRCGHHHDPSHAGGDSRGAVSRRVTTCAP